jgi:hypothetical protein
LTRRPRGKDRGGQGLAPAPTDTEATTTAAVIAGLRRRLTRQDTLEHPAVLRELSKLEQQVTAQLDQAGRAPGRHRSPHGQQVSDACGYDLKPDPLDAASAGEFIIALQQYKAWSGEPSWRKMAERAGQAVVHSTMYAAMHADALPRFEVVRAIIIGCGGGEEDLKAFATAWRRIESGRAKGRATDGAFLTAPLPPLRLVPVPEHA